jgi:hypothetical protein
MFRGIKGGGYLMFFWDGEREGVSNLFGKGGR